MPDPLLSDNTKGDNICVPSAPSTSNNVPLASCPIKVPSDKVTMDPSKLIGFVPSYDGDSDTIYTYLNNAKQWLSIAGGNTPPNVMLLLSKLIGKASIVVSMIDHSFNWDIVEEALKSECGDNREFNTLLVELSTIKKKTSYKDLIFELKQKLFYIKSKLNDKHKNIRLVEEIMDPYINTAQNTLRNSLPYHDQIYVSNCTFNDTARKILQLEAEGRFYNIKQKFSNLLPAPKLLYNNFGQHKPVPQNNYVPQHSYPTSSPQRVITNVNNSQPYHVRNPWRPNYQSNVFARPQHKYFNRSIVPPPPRPVVSQSQDVTMRTAPQLRPGQVNLGKGYVAEEVFHYPSNYNVSEPPPPQCSSEGYGEQDNYGEFYDNYLEYEYENNFANNSEPQNFCEDQIAKDTS